MWTREIYQTNIPNLLVYLVRQDGVAKHYAIFPEEGYIVRVPALDAQTENSDGSIATVKYFSRGGGAEPLSYDWSQNRKGYSAVRETEGSAC